MSRQHTITLQEINEENFKAVINLEVASSQKQYVSSNVKSLAECYIYRNNGDVFPFALVLGKDVVGFALLDVDDEDGDVQIWRIMIGEQHQNKGYGRQALHLLHQWAINHTNLEYLSIDYIPGNEQAKHLYESYGFKEVKINEHGEVVMVLKIR